MHKAFVSEIEKIWPDVFKFLSLLLGKLLKTNNLLLYDVIQFCFQHVRLLLVLNGGTAMTDLLLKMSR